jgi:hypothetical protein
MSTGIRWLTIVFLLVPVGLGLAAMMGASRELAVPAAVLAVLIFLTWFAARPTRFEITRDALLVVFPAWTRTIRIGDGLVVRSLDLKQFRDDFGTALRIGVGGLWGGFGWLWTSQRGLIEFYISRTDGFVLVERSQGRPLLITPDNPAMMVEALTASSPPTGTRW